MIAVAVARWLRRWRTHTGDGFAARLALAPPPGKDWCVFREGPRKVSVVHGIPKVRVKDVDRTSTSSFDPVPIIEALSRG